MARASSKSSAKAAAAKEPTPALDAAPAPLAADLGPPPAVKENRGRELLELRVRWKIVNEMVEAGLAERKRLREAIEVLAHDMKQTTLANDVKPVKAED